MADVMDQVPAGVRDHLKQIAKDAKGDDPEMVAKVAAGWLDKKKVFEDRVAEMEMEEVDSLPKDSEDGALALTYSGSLVTIGPLSEGARKCSYSSIGFRTDIPDAAEHEASVLKKDAKVDDVIAFDPGPVKSTSKIFKIAVMKGDLNAEEQEENLDQATTVIQEDFVEVNKTVMMD